jgi:tol-pal system protein YbgF
MIRRTNLARYSSLSLAFLFLLSGCLKTRSDLKSETNNPDSGYETKVTDVQNANAENQKVSEELRGEINRLNGRIDELQKKNESMSQEAGKRGERDAQMRDMESKVQELQASQAALIEALQKKEKDREEKIQKEKEVPKTDPAAEYEAGKAAHKEKKYDAAVEAFTKYLKFPKGKYTEDALFLRGESLYAKENYKKAILDYSSLQEKFPKSKNISKALLKMGMSFDALGMKSDAKPFYQEILEKHAKAPEAKAAKAKLK